jgi:hydrogenase expression/formation protein HypC
MCLGIPGEIEQIHERNGLRMADVRFAGISREVCLDCVPEAQVGDFVLVHVGFAISRIDRELAEHAYRTLDDMGVTAELTADRPDQEPEP